jgi:hypothetical protein
MKKALANWRNTAIGVCRALRIGSGDFVKTPPILVYQMGKVASTTVFDTLEQLGLANPVYQIHFLTPGGIERGRAFYRSINASTLPEHIVVGMALAWKLRRTPGARCKVITLVRDPIARDISGFFQHAETSHRTLTYEHGQVALRHTAEFRQELERFFEAYDETTDFACTWFDSELKTVFGIDVYRHPFPHESGYTIIRGNSATVLVLRAENLNQCLATALREFLELPEAVRIPVRRANTVEDRRVADAYRRVSESLRLNRGTCERVYASRHCRHFYSDREIQGFIARWTGSAGAATAVAEPRSARTATS